MVNAWDSQGGGWDSPDEEAQLETMPMKHIQEVKVMVNSIQAITRLLKKYDECISNMGTNKDTMANRQNSRKLERNISTTLSKTQTLHKQTKDKYGESWPSSKRKKLQRDLDTAKRWFEKSNNKAKLMGRQFSPRKSSTRGSSMASPGARGMASPGARGAPYYQAQDQMFENPVIYDEDLEKTQEEQIYQIEQEMNQVAEIFEDLAELVDEQGTQIDTLEMNVESVHHNLIAANKQIIKSADYQKKKRKRMCCFLGLLAIAAAVLAIVIYLAFGGDDSEDHKSE